MVNFLLKKTTPFNLSSLFTKRQDQANDGGNIRRLQPRVDPMIDPTLIRNSMNRHMQERIDRLEYAIRRARRAFTAYISFDWFRLDYNPDQQRQQQQQQQ